MMVFRWASVLYSLGPNMCNSISSTKLQRVTVFTQIQGDSNLWQPPK